MESLPINTQLPFEEWLTFLLALLNFLHKAMTEEELAYSIMHTQSSDKNMSTLRNFDAYAFLSQQFPREAAALSINDSIQDSAALLQRASVFAKSSKYQMDIKYKCSARWAIFLYYIVHNRYPTKHSEATYDLDQCVAGILSSDPDRSRRLVDFPNLLTRNPSHMYALLNEHPLALRLYGAAIPSSSEGIQRLMIMGLVAKHVQLATGSKMLTVSSLHLSFVYRLCRRSGIIMLTGTKAISHVGVVPCVSNCIHS